MLGQPLLTAPFQRVVIPTPSPSELRRWFAMGKIFICYRRDDSQHQAGRIYDRLAAKFGEGNVFFDVDAIPFAVKFPERIQTAIAECDVLLALIGEHWLDAHDNIGNRRLENPDDYVRLEIEEALRQGVATVPVLLDRASMPSKDDLPPACRVLADVNAPPVRAGSDFKHDVDRLLESIGIVIVAREGQRAEEQGRLDRERKSREQAERQRQHNENRQLRELEAAQRAGRRRAAVARVIAGLRSKFSNKLLVVALAVVAIVALIYTELPEPKPQPPPSTPVRVPSAPVPAARTVGENTITNSIGMALTLIPAGEFMMGSPESELALGGKHDDTESPQHRVTVTRPFYLGTTEVTQSQWEAVMRTSPWHGQENVKEGPDYPATYVNWDDAGAFCQEMSRLEAQTYRLPTEAEWEYACRAGTTTCYSFGDDPSKLGDFDWCEANAWDVDEKYAHRVGQKLANPFGLYDMHGNVWEWCSDWYAEDYYARSLPTDPFGPSSGSNRVIRGGSWSTRRSVAVRRVAASARRSIVTTTAVSGCCECGSVSALSQSSAFLYDGALNSTTEPRVSGLLRPLLQSPLLCWREHVVQSADARQDCCPGERGRFADAQLGHRVRLEIVDRCCGQPQNLGGFVDRTPEREQADDLGFSFGKRLFQNTSLRRE